VELGIGIESECREVLGIHSSLNLSDPLLKRKTEKREKEICWVACLWQRPAFDEAEVVQILDNSETFHRRKLFSAG
jgi:hypothetical protein